MFFVKPFYNNVHLNLFMLLLPGKSIALFLVECNEHLDLKVNPMLYIFKQ